MIRCAIVLNGVVINVIDYDSAPVGTPPGLEEGSIAIPSDEAGPGWIYQNGALSAPALPAVPAYEMVRREMDGFESDNPVTQRGLREGFLNISTALGLPVATFLDVATPLDSLIQANQAAWNAIPYGIQRGIAVEREMIIYRQQYHAAGGA